MRLVTFGSRGNEKPGLVGPDGTSTDCSPYVRTPPGAGIGCKPPEFLKARDVVELAITGLGSQRGVYQPA